MGEQCIRFFDLVVGVLREYVVLEVQSVNVFPQSCAPYPCNDEVCVVACVGIHGEVFHDTWVARTYVRWIVYLEDGEWCFTEEECRER